ncbi:chloride conductance regulatory protein ICln-like isoform X1 [Primulina eburnea]|uniref:chloride conductance regulatory protein ICln-like isoform X1 n=1 Tax=Primulina eburnea TaxID=1245227 RepID=UPI003C6C1CA0
MAAGLRFVTERAGGDAGQPFFDEDNGEELMHMQPGVSIVLGNRPPEFPGTLYISTKRVVWLSDTDRAKGYAVDIVSVSLHAVSRDPETYPSPCIYAQIESGAEDDEMDDSDSDSNNNLDLSKITEMRLVPSDPNQVDTLFAIFCECAELNPDPIEDDDGEGHNWNFGADQLENEGSDDEDSEFTISQNSTHTIGANGNNDLSHSVVQLQIDDQRFEDAEESEQNDKNGHH